MRELEGDRNWHEKERHHCMGKDNSVNSAVQGVPRKEVQFSKCFREWMDEESHRIRDDANRANHMILVNKSESTGCY